MSFIKICKCGSLASWNSYFGGYYCHNCGLILEDDLPDGGRAITNSITLNREAWKPCELCGSDKLDGVGISDHFGLRVYFSGGYNKLPENERFQFCPKCGYPLTDAAWAELEKKDKGYVE